MNKPKVYLLCVALFTLLFMLLILLGSYLISIDSKQFGVAAFLFAFAAAFGQIAFLALYLRQKALRDHAARVQSGKDHV